MNRLRDLGAVATCYDKRGHNLFVAVLSIWNGHWEGWGLIPKRRRGIRRASELTNWLTPESTL
jgi:hypothetical protein